MPQTQATPASGKSTKPTPTPLQVVEQILAKRQKTQNAIVRSLLEMALEVGTQYGLGEGEILGMRRVLLESITCRFGPIPLRLRRRIDRITSEEELLRLARQVVTAETLAGLRL